MKYTICIKTGAHVYIEPYNEWFICDAFMTPGETLICKGLAHHKSNEKHRGVKHFTLKTWEFLWNNNCDKHGRDMLIFISDKHNYVDHGYNGISIEEEEVEK